MRFFLRVLTGSFSLKSERQLVPSGLQDFAKYSSWPEPCCGVDSLDSSSNRQFHFQASTDRSKANIYDSYDRHFHVPQLLQLSDKSQIFVNRFEYQSKFLLTQQTVSSLCLRCNRTVDDDTNASI